MHTNLWVLFALAVVLAGCSSAPAMHGVAITRHETKILSDHAVETLGECATPIKLIAQCSNEHINKYGKSCVYAFIDGNGPNKPNARYLIASVDNDYAAVHEYIWVMELEGKLRHLSVFSGCGH